MPSPLARFTAWSSQMANRRGIYLGRRSTRVHVALYRWSRGRLGGHLPGWPAARIALLDHTGARTGRRRTSPLMFKELGGSIAVTASNAGQPRHPAWYHNLRANPETTIQVGRDVREVRARVAAGEERERIWQQFVDFFPGFEFYRDHARPREIPVVVLDPRQ